MKCVNERQETEDDGPSISKFARSCCFCSRVNCIVQVRSKHKAKSDQNIIISYHVIA